MARTTMSRYVVLGAVSVLVGCGGSGGSGGNGGDRTETQRPQNLALTLDPDNYADRRVSITTEEKAEAIINVYASGERIYQLAEEIRDTISSGDPESVSGNEFTFECLNDGTLRITVNSDETDDDERWLFSDCELTTESFGRILLNGDYRYVDDVSSTDSGGVSSIGFQFFAIKGTLLNTGDPIEVKGLDDWDRTIEANGDREEVYGAEALEFKIGDQYLATANAVTELKTTDSTPTTLTIKSTLIGSDIDGFVEISTKTALQKPSGGNECPQKGNLFFDGEGTADADILYGDDTGVGQAATVVFNGGSNTIEYDDVTCKELIY